MLYFDFFFNVNNKIDNLQITTLAMLGVDHKVILFSAESGGLENSICCIKDVLYQMFTLSIKFSKAENLQIINIVYY